MCSFKTSHFTKLMVSHGRHMVFLSGFFLCAWFSHGRSFTFRHSRPLTLARDNMKIQRKPLFFARRSLGSLTDLQNGGFNSMVLTRRMLMNTKRWNSWHRKRSDGQANRKRLGNALQEKMRQISGFDQNTMPRE